MIAQANGERSLILRTNAVPETYSITLRVATAPLPLEVDNFSSLYLPIGLQLIFSIVLGHITVVVGAKANVVVFILFVVAFFASLFNYYYHGYALTRLRYADLTD
ncbi:hypothetical protein [Limnofasciculus baicalensis]|uniref:Uncharacterized protein n=1 Tax=Limnofasciculus baicalensis BBK-W-15 TaxID=2699891 RepID=A0AAE3GVL5_9CYAN|nr:hypothetical protein [Limnofasciculus baicalensis]MCP2730761.1 hypothetical protein [Limnofasciculus baicalensis BBK-W-15]